MVTHFRVILCPFGAVYGLFWGLGRVITMFLGLLIWAIYFHFLSILLTSILVPITFRVILGLLSCIGLLLGSQSGQKTVLESLYSY